MWSIATAGHNIHSFGVDGDDKRVRVVCDILDTAREVTGLASLAQHELRSLSACHLFAAAIRESDKRRVRWSLGTRPVGHAVPRESMSGYHSSFVHIVHQ